MSSVLVAAGVGTVLRRTADPSVPGSTASIAAAIVVVIIDVWLARAG